MKPYSNDQGPLFLGTPKEEAILEGEAEAEAEAHRVLETNSDSNTNIINNSNSSYTTNNNHNNDSKLSCKNTQSFYRVFRV